MLISSSTLTALVYDVGEGAEADALLAGAASRLAASGVRLAGTLQEPSRDGRRHRCDLVGRDLATQLVLKLSEDRGPAARGCRLDRERLERLAGLAVAALEAGAEALFVSRFGKREAEGGGFRSAVALAICREVPVLVSVGRDHLPAWRAFAGGLGDELPASPRSVDAWTTRFLDRRAVTCAA